MRYKTIKDLPYVWQLNLPEAAQQVFKDAYNRVWAERGDEVAARRRAIEAVREEFVKDPLSARWMPKRAEGREVTSEVR